MQRAGATSRKRPAAYQRTTLDQKEFVIQMFNEGKTIKEAASIAGINVNTSKAIIHRCMKNGGQIKELKWGGSRSCKLSQGILQTIEQIIEENSTISIQSISTKIRELENVSLSNGTVRNGLFNLLITLKRSTNQVNRFKEEETIPLRQSYAMHFLQNAPVAPANIIFIGETGFNFHIRKNNYTRCDGNNSTVNKARGRDVTIFSAMNANGIVLSKTFANYAIHPRVFCEYLREVLMKLEELKLKNAWIILDNHELHNSQEVHQLVDSSGHVLTFLPPCSPMLNLIGNVFSKIKLSARDILSDAANNMSFLDVIECSANTVTPADCQMFYLNMITHLSLTSAGQTKT